MRVDAIVIMFVYAKFKFHSTAVFGASCPSPACLLFTFILSLLVFPVDTCVNNIVPLASELSLSLWDKATPDFEEKLCISCG